MRTFEYDPNRFADFRKLILRRALPLTLLTTAAGLYIGLRDGRMPPGSVNVMLVIVPLAIAFSLFSLWKGISRGVERQRVLYDSYRLTIDGAGITREQLDMPTIRMANDDISRITRNANGSFTVVGRNPHEQIAIDARIQNHDELEQLLRRIRPFDDANRQSPLARFPGLPAIVVIILFAAVFLSGNTIIVTLCGVILLGLLGWSFIEVRKSKHIDAKTKRGLYFIVLPVYAVLVKLFYLWF